MTTDNRYSPEELAKIAEDKAKRDAAAERFFAENRARAAEGKPARLVQRRGWNIKKPA